MFEGLSDKILGSLKKVRGQHKISETNIEEAIKEIRLSLLEADVNFKVVKSFTERVKNKALGHEVLGSLTPGQQFVKVVHDEIIHTLGTEAVFIDVRKKPSVIFLVGLQGAGKTTTAAKLALYLRQKLGKKAGLFPADVYRPAAIEQLKVLGANLQVPVYQTQASDKPEMIVKQIPQWAEQNALDVVIVDTAGRLQIDAALMEELKKMKQESAPVEILLVADSMLGQQAVQVAEGFHQALGLTGLVLTKVDGDSRGGAALSIREVTGVPIKFLGLGEKVAALEVFHPDRLASRILGMGDVLSLVEKTQEVIDEKVARDSAKKMARNEFDMEDFLQQIQYLKKLGGLEGIMKFLPGMGQITKQLKNMAPPDDEIKKIEAIIRSMTPKERKNHKILNGSRRLRIANGSGTEVSDVNKFVKQFEESKKMMSQMMKMGMGKGMKLPF